MPLTFTLIVASCAFSMFLYLAGKFANDGRHCGFKWYHIVFPLVIIVASVLYASFGYNVISALPAFQH